MNINIVLNNEDNFDMSFENSTSIDVEELEINLEINLKLA